MSAEHPGWLRRVWAFLRKPSSKYSLMTLLTVGFVGGIIFWGGFNTAMEATNRLGFCISCHEMRDNVYKEYQETVHYSNRTGVRAICSDCHVPHEWTYKMMRKISATFNELPDHVVGKIDTREKFEAHRMELAQQVWAQMKAVDSRECRNCHTFDGMSADKQRQSVYNKHMQAKKDGQTCIDCHKGIAHHLPKEYRDPNEEE